MTSEYGKGAPLSYNKYLKVPELIRLQETLSDPLSHDELLFIVIHQTYELWFKQILHELDATIKWLGEGRSFRVNHSLRSVVAIEKCSSRKYIFSKRWRRSDSSNFAIS